MAAGDKAAASSLDRLAKKLGHRFANEELLREALSHPSMGAASPRSYERLEFLGDRVLGLVIADLLMRCFPAEPEGALARRFAALVNRDSLVEVAQALDLGRHLALAKGEADSGGRENPANLADAMEAVIGALYLDAGYDAAHRFVAEHWTTRIEADVAPPQDAKTALQEWAQAEKRPLPVYRTVAAEGPSHEPVFLVEVEVEGFPPASARGPSKRAAERAAAAALLARLTRSHDG